MKGNTHQYIAQSANVFDERLAVCGATIESEEVEVVSFDVFDTLLTRRFFEPKDLFQYMANDPLLRQVDPGWDFAALRVKAERSLRLRLKDAGKQVDPTLDDIYDEFIAISGISAEAAASIQQKEIETEIEFVRPRQALVRLYDMAVAASKKVILVSDMYLPVTVLEEMLEKIGCRGPHQLFHSAECGFTKKHGTIFPHIAEKLGVEAHRFLHFGDNLNSDVRCAEAADWKAYWVPDYRKVMFDPKGTRLSGLLPNYSSASQIPNSASRLTYALIQERVFGGGLDYTVKDEEALSAEDFGYIGLGPFILSLALWVRRLAAQKGIEKIAWLARDGYLVQKAFLLIDETAGEVAESIYLPISRKMLTPFLVHQPGGIDRILDIGFSPHMTVGEFVGRRFGSEGLAVIKDACGESSEYFLAGLMRDQFHHVATILNGNRKKLRECKSPQFERLKQFYCDALGSEKQLALFDVGRKGSFQTGLRALTGQDLHGFYTINSYEIERNAPGKSYDSFLGHIDRHVREKNPDTIIYEALLSEREGSFSGLDDSGNLIRSDRHVDEEEDIFFARLHNGAMEFVRDALATHGSRVTELEQEPYYASYALENWAKNSAASALLSSVRHEDVMSTSQPRSLGDYLQGRAHIEAAPQFPPKTVGRRRVAIYCPAITRIRGGAERIAARLANRLHKSGYEVLVYSSGRSDASLEPVYPLVPGIHVRNVDTRDPQGMGDILRSFDPEAALVLASGPVVVKVSRVLLDCGIPYMLSERASPDASMRVYWKKYSAEDYFTTYECATSISVQCQSFKDVFPEYLRGRISVLPNPIEMVGQSDIEREKTILCAARIWFEQKRQDVLLCAFAKVASTHPDWRLKFFGDAYGSDGRELAALAKKLGVERQVDISPATPDIASHFEKASIFVLPSSFEGFPNSLAEALAKGTPSIGFQSCPGVNELIVDGQNGILVEDGDLQEIVGSSSKKAALFAKNQLVDRLAKALASMMDAPDFRSNASLKALDLIKQYDADTVLESWEREVNSLCEQDGRLFMGQRRAAIDALMPPEATVSNCSKPAETRSQRKYQEECDAALEFVNRTSILDRPKRAIRLLRGQRLRSEWEEFDARLKPNGPILLPIPADFSEEAYLAQNPDVEEAVNAGDFQSGYVHYLRHGFSDGRARPSISNDPPSLT